MRMQCVTDILVVDDILLFTFPFIFKCAGFKIITHSDSGITLNMYCTDFIE